MARVETEARVQELLEPFLTADGFELVDLRFSGGALQVFIDRDGGIDLDAISVVTTRVSRLLDEHDPVPGRYTLEVSSPGVERALRQPKHFQRFVGSTVSVKTRPEVAGERRQQGRLAAADEEGIVVVPAEGPGKGLARRLAYHEIERARTVFEWGPEPKPGQAPRKKARGQDDTAPGGAGAPASARRTGLGPRPGQDDTAPGGAGAPASARRTGLGPRPGGEQEP